MGIEIYAHEVQHELVDIKTFEKEIYKFVNKNINMKIFFINNPRIKNIENTNIDLLLILAVENKDKNYLIIKNNENIKYFNNLIIPITFNVDFKEEEIKFPNKQENYIAIISNDTYEEDIESQIQEIYFNTKKLFREIMGLR